MSVNYIEMAHQIEELNMKEAKMKEDVELLKADVEKLKEPK